jgi:hypothetical protein
MSLRAANDGGFSASSNAITLTFPGPCSGPPLTPINFLAYNVGSTVNLIWDPAVTGPAPTEFVLIVSGSFVGNVPTTSRVVSAAAPRIVRRESRRDKRLRRQCGHSDPGCHRALTTVRLV